jgi:hypothetical protein
MAPRPPMRPAMSPRMKAAKKKAQNKKDAVNAVKTAGVVGLGLGTTNAVLTASEMSNPGTRDVVTRKAVDLPDGGSAMTDVFERVQNAVPPMNEIVSSAADAGVKAALLGVGATLAYKGAKRLHRALNEHQFNRR